MVIPSPRRDPVPARRAQRRLGLAALLLLAAGSGCAYVRTDLPYAKLSLPYHRTQLKSSTSLEVLNLARDPAYQFAPDRADPVLLTQSDTAIAHSGRSADGRKTWLTLVAFDEFRMTAARKCFFCIDERATAVPDQRGRTLFPPRRGLVFDAEVLVDPEVLTLPYATQEARQIAVAKWLAERFQSDMTLLRGNARNALQGNEQLTTAGLMVRQMFQGLLTELAQSPGLARNFATAPGVAFPHASLGPGRARLFIETDTALLTVRVNFPLPPSPPAAGGPTAQDRGRQAEPRRGE
ncbi:MAG: hypothetical protein MUC88_17065 [Planctomycetes bacterium]|jgi:hypothetical protein|nr:hypothetical protein [Planctomycetota bacterium]